MDDIVAEPNTAGHPEVQVPYTLRRLGILMRPQAGIAMEAGGVLNPGGVRGPDDNYYLFPRLVAPGNFSRIGLARVRYDAAHTPVDVERLGVALEPEQAYEKNATTGGGCEDPRVMFVEDLGAYLMTYVAYGSHGPRVALARSTDLVTWTRLGLVDFAPYGGADMNIYGNKDALIFPTAVPGPDGRPSIAMIHRPMYEVWDAGSSGQSQVVSPPPGISDRRWSMWISFCPLDRTDWATENPKGVPTFGNHQLLITPDQPWEALRLGGGTPPVRLPEGWFTIYHGIGLVPRPDARPGLRYSAGALVLALEDPCRVLYRSHEPTLEPALPEERSGIVSDVVFPTAVDLRDGYMDVYYGMADLCIGVARMELQKV